MAAVIPGGDPGLERRRLAALRRYDILDTPAEADFDDFTRLASQICGTPIALISLVEQNRQWFKSEFGLGVRETPIEVSVCRHAIQQKDVFVVPDMIRDERFKDSALVHGDPHMRFYAGAPLESSEGLPLGTLCVIDREPRALSAMQSEALQILARQVMAQFELRLTARELARRNAELEAAQKEIATLEGLLPICAQCKKIRDSEQDWVPVEAYMARHADVTFSHGLCPVCAQAFMDQAKRLIPEA